MSTNEELLERKVAAQIYKSEITAMEIHSADYATPLYL
jgi:hypothetical protein